jgi:proteasome lid subunit RPN8/RPN11
LTFRADLPPAVVDALRAAARAAHPNECCGLLEGMRDGDVFRVDAVHPAHNLAPRSDRFEIDPADHIAAQKAARANGRSIIGCYHSHPDGAAAPSDIDAAGAAQEDFLWAIVAGEDVGCFVYRDGGFRGCVTGAD